MKIVSLRASSQESTLTGSNPPSRKLTRDRLATEATCIDEFSHPPSTSPFLENERNTILHGKFRRKNKIWTDATGQQVNPHFIPELEAHYRKLSRTPCVAGRTALHEGNTDFVFLPATDTQKATELLHGHLSTFVKNPEQSFGPLLSQRERLYSALNRIPFGKTLYTKIMGVESLEPSDPRRYRSLVAIYPFTPKESPSADVRSWGIIKNLQQLELEHLERYSPKQAEKRRTEILSSPPLHYDLKINGKALSLVALGPEAINKTRSHLDPAIVFFLKDDMPAPASPEGRRIIFGTRTIENTLLSADDLLQPIRNFRLGLGFMNIGSFVFPSSKQLQNPGLWEEGKLPPFVDDLPSRETIIEQSSKRAKNTQDLKKSIYTEITNGQAMIELRRQQREQEIKEWKPPIAFEFPKTVPSTKIWLQSLFRLR